MAAMARLSVKTTLLAFAWIIASLSLRGAQNDTPAEPDGDFSTEGAVVIVAQTAREGAAKETNWLRQNYPNYKIRRFVNRRTKDDKVYDFVFLRFRNGSTKMVVFEVSSFSGKK